MVKKIRAPRDAPSHTVGILTARLSGPNEINLWHGVAERAKERNTNLIFFSGGIPHWAQLYEEQRNILFNFAGSENVDGLLVWSNILSHTLDPAALRDFCLRYAPLPIISMGAVVPSIQSIRIDMHQGIQKLVSHLIEDHGRRKIAFIRGPSVSQDAEERFSAFVETLQHYCLPVDRRLIIPGDFRRDSGSAAVEQLLNTPRLDFDAVVSANDNMAIGALQTLQTRGVRVPEDVILAGFDDIEETRAVSPSLTTIRAPWHALGSRSMELLFSQMEGEPLSGQVLLETELVRRQSCGCQQAVLEVTGPRAADARGRASRQRGPGPAGSTAYEPGSVEPGQYLTSALSSIPWLEKESAEGLVTSFVTDLSAGEEQPGSFLSFLHRALVRGDADMGVIEWQEVLNLVHSQVTRLFPLPAQAARGHDLLASGLALIGEVAHRQQLSARLQTMEQTDRLNHIVQTMSTTHDMETLMNLLAAELPRLGIRSCFLSLYDEKGDAPAWSRLVLAMVKGQRMPLENGGVRFPTRQLVPSRFLPKDQFAFDVEALHFQAEQIGFVMFEIGPRDGEVYTTLQGHISSALKSAELVQVALEAQSKAIMSDQLKTRLLANVSHELRTPLNIILGLSQTALESPNPYGIQFPDQLTRDLGYIYDSGEHLIRLINDLLDTSRAEIGELDLFYEPVSPVRLLKEVFDGFSQGTHARLEEVEMVLEIPEHLPILQADPVRLRQILLNLLSNASKYTRRGRITLGAEIQLPHIHFWVSDTGSGISPELQQRIFEPFVKADPPGQRREGVGLGLSITRRLVALHGGTVTLESVPGQGSSFHVYLPLPGLDRASASTVEAGSVEPLLLWLSSRRTTAPTIEDICIRNGLTPYWLGSSEDLDKMFGRGSPAALAWDLDHARPGDWSLVLKLRTQAQFCQLPLLIFHDDPAERLSGGSRLTNILLKPAGKETLRHVLDLLPDSSYQGKIWIVDDDPQALRYYEDIIGQSLPEFRVRPIHGGRDAIRLLEEETPELVLLDLLMPEVDGFQVLEQLRGNVQTARIPVIIITGKILSYEDVKRLDAPRVVVQTKGLFSEAESVAEIQRVLATGSGLPRPTAMLVKQASVFIQQNYTRAFSLDELAETIGVSKSYLSRIFKMDTGISPWDFLNRFRIRKARELLLLTDQSITGIAREVGYEDAGYFGRVFREIVGCSPRAYRQRAHAAGEV